MTDETKHHILRLTAMQRDCAARFNGAGDSAALLAAIEAIARETELLGKIEQLERVVASQAAVIRRQMDDIYELRHRGIIYAMCPKCGTPSPWNKMDPTEYETSEFKCEKCGLNYGATLNIETASYKL